VLQRMGLKLSVPADAAFTFRSRPAKPMPLGRHSLHFPNKFLVVPARPPRDKHLFAKEETRVQPAACGFRILINTQRRC